MGVGNSVGAKLNNRRKLVMALGAGALVAPFGSFAQQKGKVWRVGFLSQRARPDSFESGVFGAFRLGMRELGYIEGTNLSINWRFADGDASKLPELVAELVRLNVDIIVAAGTPAASASQKATTTIPIVMATVGDPIGSGLVKTFARPGGNITGLSNLSGDLGPKLLEMLLSLVPRLSRVGILVNPANSSHAVTLKNIQASAPRVGVKCLPIEAKTEQEIRNAFSTLMREHAGAIIIANDPLFIQQGHLIAELALKHRLPSIGQMPDYAVDGGVLSYGQNLDDNYRRAATYVDKILKGAKPSDLPVEQPMKFELLINRKTAKALALTIPQSLMISADKVIE
jgi:putative ABC transport system substrate-binding protein